MTIEVSKGKLRIRFTRLGTKFLLCGLGDPKDTRAYEECKEIGRRIKQDISSGRFNFPDSAAARAYYCPNKTDIHALQAIQATDDRRKAKTGLPLADLIEAYCDDRMVNRDTYGNTYSPVVKVCEKFKAMSHDCKWLKIYYKQVKRSTVAKVLGCCRRVLKWAARQDLIPKENPYADFELPREKAQASHANPFTDDEVTRILECFESGASDSPRSAYSSTHYYPFAWFLFHTGCRPGEAAALTWDRINFINKTLLIDRALAKDYENSDSPSKLKLAGTKTGIAGSIKMSDDLLKFLKTLLPDSVIGDEFVFPGLRQAYISPSAYRACYKRVLKHLGIAYRKPYQTRHTALSKVAVSQGLLAAAKLARHTNAIMAAKHYGKFLADVELPSY